MMSRRGIIFPLTLLIFGTIMVTLAASFASMLIFPPPPARTVTLREVTAALQGAPVDGLRRAVSRTEPQFGGGNGSATEHPMKLALAAGLQVEPSAIRLGAPAVSFHVTRGPPLIVGGNARMVGADLGPSDVNTIGIALLQADSRFPPFEAAYQRPDGTWTMVEPDASPVSAWYARILAAFCAAAILLLPLGYAMARRITQPLRRLASTAESVQVDRKIGRLAVEGPAEVRTLAETLNGLLDRISDQMKAHEISLAAIAHDLRTPLTALRVRAEDSGEDVRESIIRDAERMEAMIAQVLAYIRGEQPITAGPVDLACCVAGVVEAFRSSHQQVMLECDESLLVSGDPIGLERVAANLIDNALRYAGSAEVRLVRAGEEAVLSVSDRGPGLEPAELAKLGQPFYRPDSSRNADSGGTGLGIAIVRQAALSHRAELSIENRPGGGLVARFSLPVLQ
jgi:signal transduction histidine kinase